MGWQYIALMQYFSNFEPLLCSMSTSNCCFLTCVQVSQEIKWFGIPISLRIFQFVVIHIVKGFSVVNETKVDVFFWNSPAFSMIQQMLTIWSLAPLPFVNPAWHLEVMVHVLLKPGLENFEHYFTNVWDECNCAVVWAFFGITFFWDWNENWPFLVL